MPGSVEDSVRFVADGLQLEGRLARISAAHHGVVICHPHPQYGGDMDNSVVRAVTAALQAAGVATLRFNFRGVGGSEGAYANGQGEANDARGAVDYLRQQLGEHGAIGLAGYSFGAIVALLAGREDPTLSHLVAIAPPVSMFDMSFINGCTTPKLFVLGNRDQYCSLAAMDQCYAQLAEPKSLLRVPGADHFFMSHEAGIADAVARFVTAEPV